MSSPDWEERFKEAQFDHYADIPLSRITYGNEMRELRPGDEPTYSVGVVRLTRSVQPDICHDCAVPKGFYHLPGCDAEECPVCHWQQIACWCPKEDDEDA